MNVFPQPFHANLETDLRMHRIDGYHRIRRGSSSSIYPHRRAQVTP